MKLPKFKRLPKHVAFIPDGNRRWARDRGMRKEEGYAYGLEPGLELYFLCRDLGIEELSVYGFTSDNTKRPPEQTAAFRKACVEAVHILSKYDASLLVVGNDTSPLFPSELKPYLPRQGGDQGQFSRQLRLAVGRRQGRGGSGRKCNGSPQGLS